MNDPAAQPIDIEEQRNWLIDFRNQQGLSWCVVSLRIVVRSSTIIQFGREKR